MGRRVQEGTKSRWKVEGRCLDLESVLTDGRWVKKVAIFIRETGLTGRSRVPIMEKIHSCIKCT